MSFEYASRLLESSEKTAFTVIDELVSVGKLHKISGPRKEDSQQQEPNQYYIPFLDTREPKAVIEEPTAQEEVEPIEEQPVIEEQINDVDVSHYSNVHVTEDGRVF